jgi:hypothetical protein
MSPTQQDGAQGSVHAPFTQERPLGQWASVAQAAQAVPSALQYGRGAAHGVQPGPQAVSLLQVAHVPPSHMDPAWQEAPVQTHWPPWQTGVWEPQSAHEGPQWSGSSMPQGTHAPPLQ